jgi:hypothetical protein
MIWRNLRVHSCSSSTASCGSTAALSSKSASAYPVVSADHNW